MKVVSYSYASTALSTVLDAVLQDAEVTVISRDDAPEAAVLMSLNHYNSLMETLYLLSTAANSAALAHAIQQDRAGQGQVRELLDGDA